MQAIRRRTQQAQRKVARRNDRHNAQRTADLYRYRLMKEKHRNEIIRQNKNIDRKERWEQWFLGPLRTGGEQGAGKDGTGAAGLLQRKMYSPSYKFSRLEALPLKLKAEKERLENARRRRALAGGPRGRYKVEKGPQDQIIRGDRVVIKAQDGPIAAYRGRIGVVVGINRLKKICAVEGMSIRQERARKVAKNYTVFTEPSLNPDRQVLLPIPFSHLRPVKTIMNGQGEKEDVILGTLSEGDLVSMGRGMELEVLEEEAQKAPAQPESEDQRLAREQASINLSPAEIKRRFPNAPSQSSSNRESRAAKKREKKKQQDKKEEKDPSTASDTLRVEVDTPTWTPTLLRAPLPGSIIDELRGKYSVFRTRHDPEFVKKVQRIESAKQKHQRWAESGGGVLDTPRKEAALRTQAQRNETLDRQGRVLREEVLEGIGRMMWDKGLRLTEEQEVEAARRFKAVYGTFSSQTPDTNAAVPPLHQSTDSPEPAPSP